MQETSVIQLDGESKVALVFGQMNEPPGARARVALTGLTVAEYFRTFSLRWCPRFRDSFPQSSPYYYDTMLTRPTGDEEGQDGMVSFDV
jgi:hypothetical protein